MLVAVISWCRETPPLANTHISEKGTPPEYEKWVPPEYQKWVVLLSQLMERCCLVFVKLSLAHFAVVVVVAPASKTNTFILVP